MFFFKYIPPSLGGISLLAISPGDWFEELLPRRQFLVFLSHVCHLSIHVIGGMNDYFVVLISFEYVETFVECDSLHMEANIFWNSLIEKERQ